MASDRPTLCPHNASLPSRERDGSPGICNSLGKHNGPISVNQGAVLQM